MREGLIHPFGKIGKDRPWGVFLAVRTRIAAREPDGRQALRKSGKRISLRHKFAAKVWLRHGSKARVTLDTQRATREESNIVGLARVGDTVVICEERAVLHQGIKIGRLWIADNLAEVMVFLNNNDDVFWRDA